MKNLFSKLMFVAMAATLFVACEDVPEPYDVPGHGGNVPGPDTEIKGGTGTGTKADPFNAVAALNYGNKLTSGEESPGYMFIKGKVVSVKEEFTTQYGNGTFYISADGKAGNFDMFYGSGWGPDFGDPCTYLDTFLGYGAGYMTKVIGLF